MMWPARRFLPSPILPHIRIPAMRDESAREVYCPHCLGKLTWALPDLPLYSLQQAMTVIPVASRNAFYQMLHRHRRLLDPPRYAAGDYGRRYRLLTAAEIRLLNQRLRLTVRGVAKWMG